MRTLPLIVLLLLTSVHSWAEIRLDLDKSDFAFHIDKTVPGGETVIIAGGPVDNQADNWSFCSGNSACILSPVGATGSRTISGSNGGSVTMVFNNNEATIGITAATVSGTYTFRLRARRADGTNSATRTFELTIREPFQMVFVVDASGSMECEPLLPGGADGLEGWSGCIVDRADTGTTNKWEMVEDAFALMQSRVFDPNVFLEEDRFGMIYFAGTFGSSVISPSPGDFVGPVGSGSFTAEILDDLDDQYDAGELGRDGTGIGPALRRAINGFFSGTVATNRRQVVFLMTDGAQNVGPEVLEADDGPRPRGKFLDDGFNLLNNEAAGAGNFLEYFVLNLDNSNNSGNVSNLLRAIASNPANYFSGSVDAAGNISYTPNFGEIFNRMFTNFSPQLIDIDRIAIEGDTVAHMFKCNDGVASLEFTATFPADVASNYDYTLLKDGIPYAGLNNIRITKGKATATVYLDARSDTSLTTRGEWTLRCTPEVINIPLSFSTAPTVAGTISGKVTDQQGNPLVGGTILVKGTGMGTVTDLDGQYSINLDAGSYELIVSYVGFPGQESGEILVEEGGITVYDFVLGNPVPASVIFTATADDHQVDAVYSLEDDPTIFRFGGPQVGARLQPTVRLSVGGRPITNATITAEYVRPGQDKGDLVARAEVNNIPNFNSEVSDLYTAKYMAINTELPNYLDGLAPVSTQITLDHKGNGLYEGRLPELDVADDISVIFRIEADDPEIGPIRRYERFSVPIRFGELEHNLATQGATTTGEPGGFTHILTYVPAYRVGNEVRLVGPGYEKTFTAEGGDLSQVVDNGDGSYTLKVLTEERNSKVDLRMLGEPIYDRSLTNFDEPYTVFPFDLSLHLGVTSPFLDLETGNTNGFSLEADLAYRVLPRFSLELIGGYYQFGSNASIAGGGLHLRYFALELGDANLNELTAAAGIGVYGLTGASAELGFGGRLGYVRSLSQRWRFLLELGYYQMPSSNFGFGIGAIGAKYAF